MVYLHANQLLSFGLQQQPKILCLLNHPDSWPSSQLKSCAQKQWYQLPTMPLADTNKNPNCLFSFWENPENLRQLELRWTWFSEGLCCKQGAKLNLTPLSSPRCTTPPICWALKGLRRTTVFWLEDCSELGHRPRAEISASHLGSQPS